MESLSKKIRNIIILYSFYTFCSWFFLYLIFHERFVIIYFSVINISLLIAIGKVVCELFKALQNDK